MHLIHIDTILMVVAGLLTLVSCALLAGAALGVAQQCYERARTRMKLRTLRRVVTPLGAGENLRHAPAQRDPRGQREGTV